MQCQILIFFSWKFVVDSTSQWWVKKIHGSHLRDKKMQHKAGERSLHCFFSFSNISSHLAKKPSYMEINPLSNVGSSIFCLLMFCLESSLREEIFQQEEWGHFWEQLCDQANGHMSTTTAKLNFCGFYWLLQEKPVDKRPAHFGWWHVCPAAQYNSAFSTFSGT